MTDLLSVHCVYFKTSSHPKLRTVFVFCMLLIDIDPVVGLERDLRDNFCVYKCESIQSLHVTQRKLVSSRIFQLIDLSITNQSAHQLPISFPKSFIRVNHDAIVFILLSSINSSFVRCAWYKRRSVVPWPLVIFRSQKAFLSSNPSPHAESPDWT
ncbi:hypothetical protein TELCIR_13622 [Teladorsagia circumcincta]|uniref:Uncharacterized protein n=1 Tax=Teladorsagia circumcincta TaxID=45464 RepID=A0A2G9U3L0_TELCI|nr:hypothetical protein TELCIR_13622 [Teladorsagia circumcincta]